MLGVWWANKETPCRACGGKNLCGSGVAEVGPPETPDDCFKGPGSVVASWLLGVGPYRQQKHGWFGGRRDQALVRRTRSSGASTQEGDGDGISLAAREWSFSPRCSELSRPSWHETGSC